MNINSSKLDANINLAQRESNHTYMNVRSIRSCGGCGQPATVEVNGYAFRCQPCANRVVNIWSEMRAAKNAALGG